MLHDELRVWLYVNKRAPSSNLLPPSFSTQMDTESPPPPYSHQECLREEVAVLRVGLELLCDQLERRDKRWDQWMATTNQANSLRHTIYMKNEEEWQKWRKSVVAVTVQQTSPVETSRAAPKRVWSLLLQRLCELSPLTQYLAVCVLCMCCVALVELILALMYRDHVMMLIFSVVCITSMSAIVVFGMCSRT
jgi:hypothetical protein